MNKTNAELFEKTYIQLEELNREMSTLSKKAPNDVINKFKLGFINTLLNTANTLLNTRYLPFKEFRTFDEDAMPTNSDVTIILVQYLGCMDKYRTDHSCMDYITNELKWILDDDETTANNIKNRKPRGR
jgi:hypothetical protein